MLELVGAAALGCACWSAVKWLGGIVVRASRRSVAEDVAWRRRVSAPIFDLAGNVLEDEMEASLHRVAQPIEIAANRLSPLGFVVMSLRLSDEVAQRLSAEHYKQVVAVVEVAADRLSGELVGCAGCGGFGGVHTAACSSWGDMLAMDQDEMLCEHKVDPQREDT